jgi:hypothetical protein
MTLFAPAAAGGATVSCLGSPAGTITSGTLTLSGGTADLTGSVGTSCSGVLATTSTASGGFWTQNLQPYQMLAIAGSYGINGGSLGTVSLASGTGSLGLAGTSATSHGVIAGNLYFSGPYLATQTGTVSGGTWTEGPGSIAAGQSVIFGLYGGSSPALSSAALIASSGTLHPAQNSNVTFALSGTVNAGTYYWSVLRASANFSAAPLYELAQSGGSVGTVSTGATYPALDASFTGTITLINSNVISGLQINYVAATDPGAGNVLSPAAYAINGVSETGTLTLPSGSNVLALAGSYGVSGTGSVGTAATPRGRGLLTGGAMSIDPFLCAAIGDVLGQLGLNITSGILSLVVTYLIVRWFQGRKEKPAKRRKPRRREQKIAETHVDGSEFAKLLRRDRAEVIHVDATESTGETCRQ